LKSTALTEDKLEDICPIIEASTRKSVKRIAQAKRFAKNVCMKDNTIVTTSDAYGNGRSCFEGIISGFKNTFLKLVSLVLCTMEKIHS
jgi:hypothetical protein